MIVRDPVHGDIFLNEHEQQILDTREMQRLRGIKQLGAASLVYPGAVHTRFDHSLGTLAMAKRILRDLAGAGHELDPAHRQLATVAALVHDVTHVPFGHTFEDERQIWPRHDSGPRTRHFLSRATDLGRTLADMGLLDEVAAVLAGRGPAPWVGQIVSSAVDADLLDYLRRDSYYTGLTQNYDERIFAYFALDGGQLVMNMTKNGEDRPDARSEVLHLLRMRYVLTERVYMHHTKVAAGAMISKAVEQATRSWLREENLYDLGDETFLDLLRRYPDPAVSDLAAAVSARRLYKRAYVLSGASLGGQQAQIIQRFAGQSREREQMEGALAQQAKAAPHEVILYCPRASLFKEMAVPVRTRQGVMPLSRLSHSPLSGDVGALAGQYADLWRLYIFAPAARLPAVQAAAEGLFGLPSEHSRPRA